MIALLLLLAPSPADLAPGAEELAAAEARFDDLSAAAEATATAVLSLQSAWAEGKPPKAPCDHERLSLGWRLERFGAAWREATQALRAQTTRLRALASEPTVSPLIAGDARARLDTRLSRADAGVATFLQASAWQVALIRPVLAACPLAGEGLDAGRANQPLAARDEGNGLVAVLARGDGVVCPSAVRADDAVVLVEGGLACWAPDDTCACEPAPVHPAAVLGPPVVEGGE
ncbi:MAG: hypothetical protein EXR71_10165 [Myxococcales bacterium]|nr:hypothetical protein [Myxococcales bacterium]